MASADFLPTREVPTPSSSLTPAPQRADADADAAKTLRAQLERLATRRNARSLRHQLSLSIAIGATVCVPLLILHRLQLADLPFWIPVAILGLALAVGIVRGLAKRIGTFEAALDADRVLGLDERLSSALAFTQPEEWQRAQNRNAQNRQTKHPHAARATQLKARKLKTRFDARQFFAPRRAVATHANAFSAKATHANATRASYVSAPSSTTLVPALLQDAASRIRVLDAKKVYPHKFDLTTKSLIVAMAALLTFAFLPDLNVLRTPEQRQFAAALKKQGDELDEIAKPILKQPQIDANAPTKKMAGKLEALARKMQRGRMGREEALLGIGQLRRDLEKATKPDANNAQPETSDVQRLREALQSQQMQSTEGQKMQQELQKSDVKKAADQLEKLADKMDKGQMTPQEKKQAAQDLKKAAEALRQSGQPDAAKKLEDAAKSLEKQAQQNGQGQQKQGQNGQKQNAQQDGKSGQSGQQGAQKQGAQKNGQSGSQEGQQGKSGQNKAGQSGGKSQSGQQGQPQQGKSSTGSGGQGQSQSGQNGQQSGGSQALRDMANSMRQGDGGGQGGNSQNLQNMLDKIKEAERNTGGNSGQQQGQSGSGQGQNSGEGKSVTPGKDLQPTDPHGAVGGGAGLGSRNHAQGVQSGGGVSKLKAKRTGDTRRWQDVWTDCLPKTRQKIDRITGKLGDSGEMQQLPTKTEAKGGTATTPYYNVYESYKKDAEDAVAKDNVPPAYKQPVKDYFESLKP